MSIKAIIGFTLDEAFIVGLALYIYSHRTDGHKKRRETRPHA